MEILPAEYPNINLSKSDSVKDLKSRVYNKMKKYYCTEKSL